MKEILNTRGLLDVAVAAANSRRQSPISLGLAIGASLYAAASSTALENGWTEDSPFAAAWLVAVDLVLGGSSVTFYENGGPAAVAGTIVSSEHRVLPDTSCRNWIADVDRARKTANPVRMQTTGNDLDCIWFSQDAELPSTLSGCPLAVRVTHAPGAEWVAVYSPRVLDHVMIETLLECAQRVLESFLRSPDLTIREVDILGEQQRKRLFSITGAQSEGADMDLSVDGVFASVAAQHAMRPALVWTGGMMTYAELDRRANAVARRLAATKLPAGARIGIALNRSPEAMAVLIGLLKAGVAYLPLDLKYPPERIAFMLEDAGVDTVVAHQRDQQAFPSAVRVFDATELCADNENVDSLSLPKVTDGESVAYVMYTSGSTGTPKGIEICHRSILRLVRNVDYVDLSAPQVMLHAAPLGFDASTLEIWGPLLNGGTCVLHHEAVPTGPGLAESIRNHGVTTAWLTAALFNAVIDDDPMWLRGLRQLLAGGEALSVHHVMRIQQALPELAVINGYGPTECTTFATTYRVPANLDQQVRSIPIGKPIPATSVYIVSPRLELVPFGLVGELCVGGRGLARGYLRRPELTAGQFVPSPFSSDGAKIYRTGDLVRFLPDGNIEFIGRRDGQIKIRGFRIEVGEIEVALSRHAGVKACAVIARNETPGGARLVAYVVAAATALAQADLRAHLSALLPDFMVPSAFVLLPALPVTGNGKLDRRALPAPENRRPELAQDYREPANAMEETICRVFAEVLGIDRAGRLDNFFELGGNSLLVMQALVGLKRDTGRPVASTVFFNNPTPAAIAAVIGQADANQIPRSRLSRRRMPQDFVAAVEPIAIIAMSGRFPGAANIETLWKNLCAGRESIRQFRDEDLDPSIPASVRTDSNYVKSRGVIDNVEMFDAGFFGISPREAELMDPQQRIFLEICWECLERGGYVPDACDVPVGVFGGMYNATYFQRHVTAHPARVAQLGEFQVMLGNEKDYIATRVANRLNLTGPAISIHTACSTSLVAIAQAVASLRSRQCDMALAGGASITCPPQSGYLYQEGAMLSPDGHTRTFDQDAQGTVFSDGAAVVLLKRLSQATADGDTILAVIRSAAVNNDGGAKASFTAPSVDGQAAVIAAALDAADIDARSISYIEAHGTATRLGDPVEIAALSKAFRRHTADTGFCRIGSVKSNFGHVVIAAGATGVIKTALSLVNECIPASLHFTTPNPEINLADTPFVVNSTLTKWRRQAHPRRAGVSSFGVGGTNAHVILEEAPLMRPSEPAMGPQLLCWSARSATALAGGAEQLAAHFVDHPDTNLADAAHTLKVGRKAFSHRACVVAQSSSQAVAALRNVDSIWRAAGTIGTTTPNVAFMFPGQGAQYARMGANLYECEPVFRDELDACFRALEGFVSFDLKDKLFSGDAGALTATAVTQPALFCVEYALARWWMSLGLRPCALIGHSVGEYVAATLAGVFQLRDAVRLVAKRGELMQSLAAGTMLAVRAPLSIIAPRLTPELALAAENSPGLCVIAGPRIAVETLRAELEAEKIVTRLLQTSHAFHSPMMDPAIAPFRIEIGKVKLSPPTIPIYSTVTARVLTPEQACDPVYWARHLREPVRFSPALMALLENAAGVLLEIGPRATLTTLARQHMTRERTGATAVASLSDRTQQESESVLLAVGRLWTRGVEIHSESLDRRTRKRRILLPTYPFERQRYWLEAAPASGQTVSAVTPAGSTIRHVELNSTMTSMHTTQAISNNRVPALIIRLRSLLEDASGIDMADAGALFVELGLDSLSLTQVAIQLKQVFKVNITFRQLMESYRSLDSLAVYLDSRLPAEATPAAPAVALSQTFPAAGSLPAYAGAPAAAPASLLEQVIQQQMQIMTQQIALLQGASGAPAMLPVAILAPVAMLSPPQAAVAPPVAPASAAAGTDEESSAGLIKYDVKKAFGAIARIHHEANAELTGRQRVRLDTFMRRYIARTKKSKEYTQAHRAHLADPRVVNGFRPGLKEIIYQIVIGKSRGSRLWDLDGNEYVDVLNGFGMNLFGWQPAFVAEAIGRQVEDGYEIGPQHPLAGEVAKLVCEMTGFDRAGLCNTGSEAVMGAVRIARTVTGRNTIVLFTGSYHGIFDEVIVRATRSLRAVPAAPGIMPSTAHNVLVLDYGTAEAMEIIKSRAHELAAVLVEPVQSRRPDFQPREFLQELRQVTQDAGTLLIFDEVVTGFRCHPGGIQALFGIRADLCTYGKIVGGGFPIGVIAGKRDLMDALDGGAWQYGDDSVPTVGVTYFAGTFVRHPLALAAAKAILLQLKEAGPELQAELTRKTSEMVDELNAFCRDVGAPIVLKSFASIWKTFFTEDHPLQDLLFGMMRSRSIHILDNFPCFFTTAHNTADIALIKAAFKESVTELQEADFIPRRKDVGATVLDASKPPIAGARIGQDPDGKPAWFVPNPDSPGKYLRLEQ